jgi:hypothetical protein
MSPEEIINKALAKTVKSAFRREELAEQIESALWDAGYLLSGDALAVEVHGARVPVEVVEAYGLDIEVDANGNAVTVSSPWGFGVAG